MRQMAKQSYLYDPRKVDARIDGSDIAALERLYLYYSTIGSWCFSASPVLHVDIDFATPWSVIS